MTAMTTPVSPHLTAIPDGETLAGLAGAIPGLMGDLDCRKNARLFRLKALEKSASPLAPKFEVLEVKSLEDERGVPIGRYRTRSDASKAVLEVAYKPKWS